MSNLIYHLAEPRDWARSIDEYRCASLDDEGFIHCSTEQQLGRVAREQFADRNNLILLTIDPTGLEDHLIWEDLYELGQDFPHLYAPLPTSAVTATGPYIAHLEEGLWLGGHRFDADWMEMVLHPDFTEVGRHGKVFSRSETITADRVDYEISLPLDGYRLDLIDEDVALVRYVSRVTVDGRTSLSERTSVWVNTNEGWRIRFHQATPAP